MADDSPSCTVDELHHILVFPSGGMFMLPSDDYNEVYPGILIGDVGIAKHRSMLTKLGVTHVLNTAAGKDPDYNVNTRPEAYQKLGIKYMSIEATDAMYFNLMPYFEETSEFIDSALNSGGKILVHCREGVSRSSTITLAYLMLKKHMTVQDALRTVRKMREICPNDGFLQQLCDFNDKLMKDILTRQRIKNE